MTDDPVSSVDAIQAALSRRYPAQRFVVICAENRQQQQLMAFAQKSPGEDDGFTDSITGDDGGGASDQHRQVRRFIIYS